MIRFKQFLYESKLPKFISSRDIQGENYDETKEVIPKGSEITIDRTLNNKDGSVDIIAHYKFISIKLKYDNKSEAEEDLGVKL